MSVTTYRTNSGRLVEHHVSHDTGRHFVYVPDANEKGPEVNFNDQDAWLHSGQYTYVAVANEYHSVNLYEAKRAERVEVVER